MPNTLIEKLTNIKTAKDNLKNALEGMGLNPGNDFSSYARFVQEQLQPISQKEYDQALKTEILTKYPNAIEMDKTKMRSDVTTVDIVLAKGIQNDGTGGAWGTGFTIGIIVPKEDIASETSTIKFDISDTGEEGTYSSWIDIRQALSDVYQATGILDNMPKEYTLHGNDMDIEMGMGYYYPDTLKANNAYPVMLCNYKVANYVRMYE